MDDITTKVYETLNQAYSLHGKFNEIINANLAMSIVKVLGTEERPDDEKFSRVYDLINTAYTGASAKYSADAVLYAVGQSRLIP